MVHYLDPRPGLQREWKMNLYCIRALTYVGHLVWHFRLILKDTILLFYSGGNWGTKEIPQLLISQVSYKSRQPHTRDFFFSYIAILGCPCSEWCQPSGSQKTVELLLCRGASWKLHIRQLAWCVGISSWIYCASFWSFPCQHRSCG